MKNLLLALVAISPMSAMADEAIHCRDVKAGPDHGYYATIRGLRTADVSSQSIMGPRPVNGGTNMRCMVPRNIRIPGKPYTLIVCVTPRSSQGLMLSVRKDGARTTATLSDVTTTGNREFAKLNCGSDRE